eukprot:1158982-Pelagomonas_calceolata.AAC.8
MVCHICMRAHRTSAEAKRHLESHCTRLKEGYAVVIVSDQEHGPCTLKCKGRGEVMSPNNPS